MREERWTDKQSLNQVQGQTEVSQVNDRSNTGPIWHVKYINTNDYTAKLILTLRPGKPLIPVPPTGPCETSQQHPKYTGQDTYSIAHSSFPRLHWKYCKCDLCYHLE